MLRHAAHLLDTVDKALPVGGISSLGQDSNNFGGRDGS